jgi:hypothetical protein
MPYTGFIDVGGMIKIPNSPERLHLKIDRCWNGSKCQDDRLWAHVELSQTRTGLHVNVQAPMLHEQSIPDGPIGSRVDGLWNFDVVEVFFVGPGHQYLEIELGAGGHFLVLGYSSVKKRSIEYDTFEPIVRFEKTNNKHWTSELVVPWYMIPENLRGMNAFAVMAGQHLAFEPIPGLKPDFHQPDYFPQVSL